MNYEFHVGDYVETWDGWIGYIDGVYTIERYLDIVWTSGNKIVGEKCRADWNMLQGNFKRIGAYDFTKKEKKKIEQLEKDLPIEGKIKDKKVIINQCLDDGYYTLVYNEKMIDKINELVDAVNLLLDKSTES